MKNLTFRFTIFLLICLTIPVTASAQAVAIPDANLRAAVETALDKAPGDPISQDEMATLTELYADNANISDLAGLESATNLSTLDFTGNSISDVSALSSLTNLTELNLAFNSVSDISALAGLTNLTNLTLYRNSVSDISDLSSLTNLTYLDFGANSAASDISALASLTNLQALYLGGNSVWDISALAGLINLNVLWLSSNYYIADLAPLSNLTNLKELYLDSNSVSDMSALAGLTNLTVLELRLNHWLSYGSIHTHIPALQSRGVQVYFDSRDPATLLKVSGELTASDNVMIVEVRDENDRRFEGVPVTFSVISGGGTLSVTDTATDDQGRAQSQLSLGSDGTPNRVEVSAAGIQESVTFSDEGDGSDAVADSGDVPRRQPPRRG